MALAELKLTAAITPGSGIEGRNDTWHQSTWAFGYLWTCAEDYSNGFELYKNGVQDTTGTASDSFGGANAYMDNFQIIKALPDDYLYWVYNIKKDDYVKIGYDKGAETDYLKCFLDKNGLQWETSKGDNYYFKKLTFVGVS